MASSRLEKIGTIFTRTTGLLKSGAMRPEDKPLWYDIYKAFPPRLAPEFARKAPDMKTRRIFYAEDKIRALFHKNTKQTQAISLNSPRATESQMFIEIYNKLQAQGPLSDEKVFETAVELLKEKLESERASRGSGSAEAKAGSTEEEVPGLVERFSAATAASLEEAEDKTGDPVNLKNIFKD